MRRVFGVGVVLLLALGLFPRSSFGQSPTKGRGSQLRQNYPNPFNPETTIGFEVLEEDVQGGRPAVVTLRIFNVLQQLVAVPKAMHYLAGDDRPVQDLAYDSPGVKEAYWDGTDRNGRKVASGIYYYQLIVNGERRGLKKMVVTK